MAKKEVKNREYLAKILYRFNYIGKEGAVEEGTKDDSEMCQVHNGFYVIAPDVIRRCYFLSCIEKEVLWELFSWASNDGGYCSVSQKIISLNVNIAESTVKKTINELYNKGFIEKRRITRRRNLYKIADVSKNPYVLLSEYIHYRLKIFLSEQVNDNERLYENDLGCNVPLSVDGKTALAFWEKYPAPHHIKGIRVEELTGFLLEKSSNTCSTKKAETILEFIKSDGDTKRDYQECRDFLIQSHVRDIKFKKEEISKVKNEISNIMKGLDFKLDTMPGIDIVTASALVAEIGDINRFSNPNKLARFAGIAPVNFSSGGKGKDQKSKQGNRTLHGIFYFLAVQQVQVSKGTKIPRNPVFYEYYQRKIAEGKTKGQALVCIMRRLVNIIYGMMKNKTPYLAPLLPHKKAV